MGSTAADLLSAERADLVGSATGAFVAGVETICDRVYECAMVTRSWASRCLGCDSVARGWRPAVSEGSPARKKACEKAAASQSGEAEHLSSAREMLSQTR
jgi:hypothetical protein